MVNNLTVVPIWHNLSSQLVAKALNTSLPKGLSAASAESLLNSTGPNSLSEAQQIPWWRKLLSELNDYLIWILLVGAGLSLLAGEWIDGSLILGIIVFMAVLGYVQNAKAENALASLKKLEVITTTVIRGGEIFEIDATELVTGDIVVLKAGMAVPADLRIVTEHNAAIDESMLTGESLPVEKHSQSVHIDTPMAERRNMAHSGTLVVAGYFTGIVVATGMNTELGKIAHLLESTNSESTPLERELERLGKTIGTSLIAIVILILGLNLLSGISFLEASLDAVALAVAAVPEGLPAIITICLAFGTQEMVKRKAMVRKLKAVEALGSISVICTDKTGTLTTGEMEVSETWSNCGQSHLAGIASLVNNNADMTEKAMTRWIAISGHQLPASKRVQEYEFNSMLKRMTTLVHVEGDGILAAVKGAPEIILEHSTLVMGSNKSSPLTLAKRQELEKIIEGYTKQGLRVLAVAKRNIDKELLKADRDVIERELTLVGFLCFSDPPKAGIAESIKLTTAAGITPIMITGDNPGTARAIAKALSWPNVRVMTGADIDQAVDGGNSSAILRATVFARVTPEHKSLIVSLFQKSGKYVAMIGDGVNDAPSVKLANVGVSMGIRGSDVTKSAADLVLLDDNYSTLVYAVEEGRAILNRIRLFVSYLLSCNLTEVALFAVAAVMRLPLPLSAILLLILNIVTDAAPALAMAKEPKDSHLMSLPPRDIQEPIITKRMWLSIAWITVASTTAVFGSYLIGLKIDFATGQTMAFTTLALLELLRAYTARSFSKSVFRIGFFSNSWTTPTVIIGALVTLAVVYFGAEYLELVHLPYNLYTIAVALALVGPLADELGKVIFKSHKSV